MQSRVVKSISYEDTKIMLWEQCEGTTAEAERTKTSLFSNQFLEQSFIISTVSLC